MAIAWTNSIAETFAEPQRNDVNKRILRNTRTAVPLLRSTSGDTFQRV